MFGFGKNKYSEIIKHQDEVVQSIFMGIESILKSQNKNVDFLLIEDFQERFDKWFDDITDMHHLEAEQAMEKLPFVVYNRYEIFAFLYKLCGWTEAFDQHGKFTDNYNWCCKGRKFLKNLNVERLQINDKNNICIYHFKLGDEYRKYDYRTFDEIITFNGETFALVDIGFYS